MSKRKAKGEWSPFPLRCLTALTVLLCAGVLPAYPQDTVQVIRPEATQPDSANVLPEAVVQEVIAAYNDSLTTRVVGPFHLPRGGTLTGPVAVFGGSIRVGGELIGKVTVINGYLIIDAGGLVRGEVLVVGGGVLYRGGRLEGPPPREYRASAQLVRNNAGLLVPRPPPRSLRDFAARRTFTTGRFRTTLSAETGGTYNRVEGLPLVLGPTITREGLPNLDARLDFRGIIWTAPDRTDRRADFGYRGRLEFRFGEDRRLTVGAQASRRIVPIEPEPLSGNEAGWAAFLLQRDYRDYYQARGFGGSVSYAATRWLTLQGSLRRDHEASVPAADPVSVFRNEAWRPNPLIDDGHYLTVRLGLELDTRNDSLNAGAGWRIQGYWERSRSTDASPLALPVEVRDPIAPGPYSSSRVRIDVRRYDRLNPSVRTSARVLAAGWVSGNPLPVQRRMSLGGPDLLPGYQFRRQSCVPATFTEAAAPALCDRLLAVQLEVRSRARLGLPIPTSNPYLSAVQRLLAIQDPDVVVFGDAGKAWVTGDGPGRVPNNRIPVLREWDYDVGLGLDFGGLAFYVAQPLSKGLPLTFTVRLQQRY
ncbi:MAG: hypothetical protein ACT4PM_15060 [Gemmatimonadales bacterium]